jgi:hypothetical protein
MMASFLPNSAVSECVPPNGEPDVSARAIHFLAKDVFALAGASGSHLHGVAETPAREISLRRAPSPRTMRRTSATRNSLLLGAPMSTANTPTGRPSVIVQCLLGGIAVAIVTFLIWRQYMRTPTEVKDSPEVAAEKLAAEQKALEALLTDYKLSFHKLDDKGHVIDLRFEARRFDDKAMDYVRLFPYLEGISLAGSSVTDAGLAKIAELKRLERMNIMWTPITDQGLKHIAKINTMRDIWLNETDELTDEGIKFLEDRSVRMHVQNRLSKKKKKE